MPRKPKRKRPEAPILAGMIVGKPQPGQFGWAIVTGYDALRWEDPTDRQVIQKRLSIFLLAAQAAGEDPPEGNKLFAGGQIFYKDRKLEEVRLAYAIEAGKTADGRPLSMMWSTPVSPTVAGVDERGALLLPPEDQGRTHFSAAIEVSKDGTALIRFTWDLVGNAPGKEPPEIPPDQTTALATLDTRDVRSVVEHQAARMTPAPTNLLQHTISIFDTDVARGPKRRQNALAKRATKIDQSRGFRKGYRVTVQMYKGVDAYLPFVQAQEGEDVIDLWMQQLSMLDTSSLLTMMACLKICTDKGQNLFPENIAAICRMRGHENLATKTRKATREELNTLAKIKFRITALEDDDGGVLTTPLLLDAGTAERIKGNRRGRPARLYSFHPIFWGSMMREGKRLYYDAAILTAHARHDAWAIHLYFWACRQWAQGWAMNRLHAQEGKLTYRMKVIVEQAGISVNWSQPKARIRQRFRAELDKLARSKWSSASLIQTWTVEEDTTDPAEDKYTFWPTQAHIDQLNASNAKRITSVRRRQKALEGK